MLFDGTFADALLLPFEGEDRVLLLLEDDVRGEEGPRGLQLVSNCLCAMETSGIAVPEDDPSTCAAGSDRQYAHFAEVEANIRRLRRGSQTHFVMAFHIAGTSIWKMAWSEDTNESEAIAEMMTFVRCNLMLDY